ncbi:hypothetical protein [Salinicoccus halitifaciens]|uniref:DNA-binding transcriptional MerR regulator n=1 Tax=Salinicoccus halitifaciens TaxID=1073415 RepID=A0ABV2EAD9_9STAP|nr:hypothetical protein [Salinicoccus halitifaciens]MCD2138504.1 hypothetical protein [Salinicoccus halitifaciens]
MKELNQSVYYTTAQVTELVELSDQNVRKYVRLLEDRKYEVAKDEHNRRLFSANDVLILRELIKKAKKPGYTLESAADEIMGEINEIISGASHKMVPANDNDEVREMFSHVISRLDDIQEENRELKRNIRNLVERLERYDENNAQRYIGYASTLENTGLSEPYKDDSNTGSAPDESDQEEVVHAADKDDSGDVSEEEKNASMDDTNESPATDAEDAKNNEKRAPSVSETPDRKNVDMSDYSSAGGSGENADDEPASEEKEKSDDASRDKGGFLDGLLKIFRK